MNGRFFDGRALRAQFWDGKTDYRVVRETDEQIEHRLDEFGRWLEGGQDAGEQEGEERLLETQE